MPFAYFSYAKISLKNNTLKCYFVIPWTIPNSPTQVTQQGLLTRMCTWVQFSSVSHVWLFATPWTAARQASLSITNSWSLLKLMSIESVMKDWKYKITNGWEWCLCWLIVFGVICITLFCKICGLWETCKQEHRKENRYCLLINANYLEDSLRIAFDSDSSAPGPGGLGLRGGPQTVRQTTPSPSTDPAVPAPRPGVFAPRAAGLSRGNGASQGQGRLGPHFLSHL